MFKRGGALVFDFGFDAIGEPSTPGVQRAIRASGDLDERQAFSFKALAGAAIGSSQHVPVKIFIENEHVAGDFDPARTVFSFVGHLLLQKLDTASYYSHKLWNVPNKQKINFSSTFSCTSAGLSGDHRLALPTMAPIFSTAARCGSSKRCAYLAVVVGFEWPNSAPISGRLAPLLAS